MAVNTYGTPGVTYGLAGGTYGDWNVSTDTGGHVSRNLGESHRPITEPIEARYGTAEFALTLTLTAAGRAVRGGSAAFTPTLRSVLAVSGAGELANDDDELILLGVL